MHLVEIDVIGLKALETALNFAHDVYASRAASIEILAHREPDFSGKNNFLSYAPQGITDQSLALSKAVYVRRVDKIDSPIQRYLHHPRCVFLTKIAHVHLAAELHRAKRHLAHDESCVPQFPILHVSHTPSAANENCDGKSRIGLRYCISETPLRFRGGSQLFHLK